MSIDIVKQAGQLYAVLVQGVIVFKGCMSDCIDRYETLRYDGIEEVILM